MLKLIINSLINNLSKTILKIQKTNIFCKKEEEYNNKKEYVLVLTLGI